jgi:hypothetical protein
MAQSAPAGPKINTSAERSWLQPPWPPGAGERSRTGAGVLDDHAPVAPAAVDRAIRVSTAVAVLMVAGIAAYVSYWHAYAAVCAHGENGITARLEPATIDSLEPLTSVPRLKSSTDIRPGS